MVNANPDSIPVEVLFRVLKVVLNHDYLRALQFAQDLGEIYKTKNKWNDFINFAKLILRPTVFDREDDGRVAPILANALLNATEILDQIDLLK